VKVKYNIKDKLLLFYPSVKVKYNIKDKLLLFYPSVKVKYNVKDKLLLFYPSVKVKYKVKDKLIFFYVNCIIPINEGQKYNVKGVLFITESQIKCCIVLVLPIFDLPISTSEYEICCRCQTHNFTIHCQPKIYFIISKEHV
jgi:hypothetical protein